jgi:hypothetical protein
MDVRAARGDCGLGGLFLGFGEFADFPTAFYHSASNFTTLGLP